MPTPDIQPVLDFLPCPTPRAWVEHAVDDLATLLLDHAALELKASQQALTLMNRYAGEATLLDKMSRLAREELRHFERVVAVLKKRGIDYQRVSASRYFGCLHEQIRDSEPGKRVDTLIVGAIVEARSCERFHALLPALEEREPELAKLYASLLESEARHFEDYLSLAESAAGAPVADRAAELLEKEAELIESADSELRFHSGVPA
ncbi:MAG: tRNA-(ms[2]io[6]A)-hydroxylase [Gammaproteobacteria bacterium]